MQIWINDRPLTQPHGAEIEGRNAILYVWNKGEHHFEIEHYPDVQIAELFYRNRSSGKIWEEVVDISMEFEVSDQAIEYMSLFLEDEGE